MHSVRTIGTCKCAVALLHPGHPRAPLFYEHFKEHSNSDIGLDAFSEGVVIDACARPGRRCSFDIDMHYVTLIHSPRSVLNISYCKTGTTDLYASPR